METKEQAARALMLEASLNAGLADVRVAIAYRMPESRRKEMRATEEAWRIAHAAYTQAYNVWKMEKLAEEEAKCP